MEQTVTEKITVIGIGRSGVKIVDTLTRINASSRLHLVAIDTDKETLDRCSVTDKILADSGWRHGAGCGGDVIKGQRSLARERGRLAELLKDTSMLIVTGGLGGGTATGGVPIISSVAADKNVPAVYMMTLPFSFEGHSKLRIAEDGVKELLPTADILMCLPNDLLFSSMDANVAVEQAFIHADIEVARAILAVTEVFRCQTMLSADFSSFRSALHRRKSTCCFGIGTANASDGLNRCHIALERMLQSPLMGGIDQLKSANAVILIMTGGKDLQLSEMKKALEVAESFISPGARVIVGANTDEAYIDTIQITAIAVRYDKTEPAIPEPSSTPEKTFQRQAAPMNREVHDAFGGDLFEQGELPLQNISKGIFVNSTPFVYNGEDLDIPTFQRKMIIIDKGE